MEERPFVADPEFVQWCTVNLQTTSVEGCECVQASIESQLGAEAVPLFYRNEPARIFDVAEARGVSAEAVGAAWAARCGTLLSPAP